MKEVVKLRSVIKAGKSTLLDATQELSRYHYEKRPGIKSVDWRRRKRSGEVVMNNHTQLIGYAEPTQVSFVLSPTQVWDGFKAPETITGTLYYSPPDPQGLALAYLRENMQQLDTTSALSIINSSELDILTQLGEARESVDMVISLVKAARHPIQNFVSIVQDIFKSPVHAYRNGMDMLANLRLLWRYGINPYYQQIKDLLDDIKVRKFSRIRWGDFSITKQVKSELGFYPGILPNAYGCNIPYVREVSYSSHQVMKVVLTLEQLLDKFFSFSVPQTIWELTRFSFVVDWFVGVQDFIGAYEDTLNVHKSGIACITHIVKVGQPKVQTPPPALVQQSGVEWYKYLRELSVVMQSQCVYYQRDVTRNVKDYIKLNWSHNFDTTHQLDGAALAWQKIRGVAVSNKTLAAAADKAASRAAQATLTNHLEFSAALRNNVKVMQRKRPIKRK